MSDALPEPATPAAVELLAQIEAYITEYRHHPGAALAAITGLLDDAAQVPAVDSDAFNDYHLQATRNRLLVTCPRPDCRSGDLIPGITGVTLTLGEFMDAAIDHEACAHGGYRPSNVDLVDTPSGSVAVHGQQPLTDQGRTAVGEVVAAVRARQSLSVRGLWEARRDRYARRRDTAGDSVDAAIAGLVHDLCVRIVADLDDAEQLTPAQSKEAAGRG